MKRGSLGVAFAILVATAGALGTVPAAADRAVPGGDSLATSSPGDEATLAAPRAAVPAASVSPPPTVRVVSASSQSEEAVRVRREILTTERILGSVRKKLLRTRNRAARQDFMVAARKQLEARDALEENLFARADRLTLEAREGARRIAIRLGPPQDDPEYVAMTLDQTDDALKRASEIIRDADRPFEQRRLDDLTADQKAARALLGEGRTRGAYAATREVRDGVLTLLRDCDDLPVPAGTAERALKRAVRSMDHARAELGEKLSGTVERLEREARLQLDKARVAFARKNYRDTLLYAKLMERKLELALAAQRDATNRSG